MDNKTYLVLTFRNGAKYQIPALYIVNDLVEALKMNDKTVKIEAAKLVAEGDIEYSEALKLVDFSAGVIEPHHILGWSQIIHPAKLMDLAEPVLENSEEINPVELPTCSRELISGEGLNIYRRMVEETKPSKYVTGTEKRVMGIAIGTHK